MARTPSTKLYDLIHKMSGSEKRYFKLYASTHALPDSKSMHLFDVLVTQETQNDTAAEQLVYGAIAPNAKKFTELKSFLYALILRALAEYDAETSIDFKLKNYLTQIRVLYKRGLYVGCKSSMEDAKKVALKYEEFTTLIEILRWEKQIAYAESNINYLVKELQRIENEEDMYLNKLKNVAILRNASFEILSCIRKNEGRSNNNAAELIQDIIQKTNSIYIIDKHAYMEQVLCLRMQSMYCFAKQDYKGFYTTCKDLLFIMESEPHFIKEDATDYISALSNFMKSCFSYEKYDEAFIYINKFNEIESKSDDDAVKIHRQYAQSMFQLCLTTGQFKKGAAELEIHFKLIERFDQQLFARASFYFAYFYLYFGNGEYEKALKYLNFWLNAQKNLDRQGLTTLSRLMNIIIHFELGNIFLLESLLISTYKLLYKNKKIFAVEKKILQFIKLTQKVRNNKELVVLFQNLRSDFEILSKIPKESTLFLYFDFISWLDSKIDNIAFSEVVQLKFQKKYMNKTEQ